MNLASLPKGITGTLGTKCEYLDVPKHKLCSIGIDAIPIM